MLSFPESDPVASSSHEKSQAEDKPNTGRMAKPREFQRKIDPLGPVFTGDQPSVASQQGPTTHEGCSLAQGSLTTVVFLGLTETSNVVKVSQRPPRVGSISRQSMP